MAGLLVVGLGILSGPLDSSVNIAFPFITRAFDAVPIKNHCPYQKLDSDIGMVESA